MREAQGTTWTFGLIVIFIMLFAAFLILTLNYTDAFRIRNDIISIVEEYEGFSTTSQEIVSNLLSSEGYNTRGSCPVAAEGEKSYYGVSDLDGTTVTKVTDNTSYYYCIKEDEGIFEIILFYKFNLPVINNLMTFDIKGSTNQVIVIAESNRLK